MALLPQRGDATLLAIDDILVARNNAEPVRNYLGASSIGDSCERKLWYRLHTDHKEVFDAPTLRRFNDGHRSEDVMAELLRAVPGVTLWTHKSETEQYGFKDNTLGPKIFSGHYDGIILGILEAPQTYHIWEHKAVNEKKFAELKKLKEIDEKSALQKWDKVYHAQGIIYMDYEGLTRHYLTVSTPGLRDYTSVRTNADPAYAGALKNKAKRIINATIEPERIGGKDYYECKWCPFYGVCQLGAK